MEPASWETRHGLWKGVVLMRLRTLALLATVLCLATPAFAGSYLAGGTFVVKNEFGTVLDNGGVVCTDLAGNGVGGGCLPFPKGAEGFVHVYDNLAGRDVAFQVCIDNNADGICGGPQLDERCRDQIFFSHADGGAFFNPLGPLPAGFLRGCGVGAPHAGYVVLLCQGVHDDAQLGPHEHRLSAGQIGLASFGTGYGDFCGGGFGNGTIDGFEEAAAKAYVVA